MNGVVQFLAGSAGRWTRIAAGTALVVAGIWTSASKVWGWALVAVGLIPIAAGAFDFCLLAPLMGRPIKGQEIRNEISSEIRNA